MQKSSSTYRVAFILALGISLLMNILFLIMFFYGRDAVMPPEAAHNPKFDLNIRIRLMHILFNFLLAFILYLINFWLLKKDNYLLPKWLVIVLVSFVCATILSYCFSNIQIYFQEFKMPHPERLIRGGFFRDYFISVVVVLSSQLIYLSEKQQKVALENKTLLTENMKTRFLALKHQVDPHFLFNSLNTLNSLIKIDADKAQEYVQQLSSVFRYTLQNKDVTTLEDELKYTYSYCHLMQIRYGESLRFVADIDQQYDSYLIIPLSLQILVENAIKHNVVSNKQPLTITIRTTEDGMISVANPIQLKKEKESGGGIGLTNLAERYRLMWKKEIIINNSDNTFEVMVPLQKEIT